MANRQYIVTQHGGAIKSIPLQAYPAEAWRSILSAVVSDDDLTKRYDDTPWFRRAIDVRASSLANLPWAFTHDNGDELPEGELPDLPFEFQADLFFNQVEAWLTMYGVAYAFKGLNAVRSVRDLRLLHPSTVTPQYDAAQGLTGYRRNLGSQQMMLTPEDVCAFWLPSRKSEVGPGTAPAKAALLAALLLNTSDTFADTYFKNGVIAPTLIELPDGTGDPDRERIQDWLSRAATGVKKAFSALAVRQSVKVTQLGEQIPLGSLALPELTDKKREDISTAFGIPQSLLFSNAANYATAQQDDLHFYDKTIVPDARLIEQAFNRQVLAPLGWKLQFKPESLEYYQQLESTKADALSKLYSIGVLTRDEVRDEMGRLPADDSLFKDTQRAQLAAQLMQVRMGQPTPSQQPADAPADTSTDTTAKAELERWQRKAIKRLSEGKADKAAAFESDVLSDRLKAYVVGGLETAVSIDDVKAVFEVAHLWEAYP